MLRVKLPPKHRHDGFFTPSIHVARNPHLLHKLIERQAVLASCWICCSLSYSMMKYGMIGNQFMASCLAIRAETKPGPHWLRFSFGLSLRSTARCSVKAFWKGLGAFRVQGSYSRSTILALSSQRCFRLHKNRACSPLHPTKAWQNLQSQPIQARLLSLALPTKNYIPLSQEAYEPVNPQTLKPSQTYKLRQL